MEIGNKLKEAREARKLSLEEVEDETKIRRKYLQALEDEQFQIIPGAIYAKAFLKNYARFLNLNVDEIMANYSGRNAEDAVPESTERYFEETVKAVPSERPKYLVYLASAVVILGLVFSVYYGAKGIWPNRSADNAREEIKKGGPAGAPAGNGEQGQLSQGQQAAPGQGSAVNAPGVNVVLNIKNDRSWISVVVDDNPAFQGTLTAGQTKNFDAKDKISVRLGDAGAVEVLVNGQNMGFLGGPGEVVNREFKAAPRG